MKITNALKITMALLALIVYMNSTAQVCFNPAITLTAGTGPRCVISADFNKDGVKDLAVSNITSRDVSILLGTTPGNFGAATNFTLGTGNPNPVSLISTDFNNDGNPDLATGNGNTGDISILLGDGMGSFAVVATYTLGTSPYSVCSDDFNGDGNADLAVANTNTNTISIFLGAGTGTFGSPTNFLVGSWPWSVVSADLNGDAIKDLAVANFNSNDVSILLGMGTGSFSPPTNFAVDSLPRSIVCKDLNGDAKLDLAVANRGSDNVSILMGNGAGGFGAATNLAVGAFPQSIVSGDFNRDNKVDLVTANYNSGNVSLLFGTGLGNYATAVNYPVGTSPNSIFSADLNNDGLVDFVTSNYTSNDVTVLLNCAVQPSCIAWVTDSIYKDASPLTWDVVANYSAQVINATWNWGDGTSTSGLSPSHTYSTPGWYTICVTAYTSCGDSATTCRNDSIYRMINNNINNAMVYVNVISSGTGVSNLTATDDQLNIYPNPTSGILNVNLKTEDTPTGLRFTNILGEKILEHKVENKSDMTQVDVSAFPEGIYFILIETNKKSTTRKFIVKH